MRNRKGTKSGATNDRQRSEELRQRDDESRFVSEGGAQQTFEPPLGSQEPARPPERDQWRYGDDQGATARARKDKNKDEGKEKGG